MSSLFITWSPDPTIFHIFEHEIRWYGLCWALGLLGAVSIVQKIYKSEGISEKLFDSLFIYVVLGTIVGARLGHCFFYDPSYYLAHPVEIIQIWKGGLASHGGAIGIIVGVYLYSRKTKLGMLWTLDRILVGAGFSAAMIRIGNLMNSEIYGRPTSLPWGFNFLKDPSWYLPLSNGGSGQMPCHPTQIYEASVYLLVFALAMWMYWKTSAKDKEGLIFGTSLVIIFFSRFFLEYLKNIQEPFEVMMRAKSGMDQGQLLSIPFMIWGVWLIFRALNKNKSAIEQ